jgi:hypothetical protein
LVVGEDLGVDRHECPQYRARKNRRRAAVR